MASVLDTPVKLSLAQAKNDWAKAIDHGFHSDVAIFDFSKAFYSVPHQRLLLKLDYYGIHGNTMKWITSFLLNDHSELN